MCFFFLLLSLGWKEREDFIFSGKYVLVIFFFFLLCSSFILKTMYVSVCFRNQYAWTTFDYNMDCADGTSTMTMSISVDISGSYASELPASRSYVVRLMSTKLPLTASVNGQTIGLCSNLVVNIFFLVSV